MNTAIVVLLIVGIIDAIVCGICTALDEIKDEEE